MKQKNSFAIIDCNAIIMHVLKALTAFSGTCLTTIKDNCINVPEMSSDFITATLTLTEKDVNLTLTSDFFRQRNFKVGTVREHDVLISDKLAMVTGLQVSRICQWLAQQGEAKPMNWFNIPIPDYDRITVEDKATTKKRNVEVEKNVLLTTDEVKPVVEKKAVKKTKKTALPTNTLF